MCSDPSVLAGLRREDFTRLVTCGREWHVEPLGQGAHAGMGWLLREYHPDGGLTGRMIKWHPGGGHHGKEPYWRASSPKYGRTGVIR
jgi:hypothetical protein